jgi:hypothetical protein
MESHSSTSRYNKKVSQELILTYPGSKGEAKTEAAKAKKVGYRYGSWSTVGGLVVWKK